MPVVVMTAWGSIDNAVEAMRRGARDYVEKPWDNARLVSILGDAGRARPRAATRAAARVGEPPAPPRPSAADDRRVAEDEADRRSSWSGSARPTRTCSSPASTAPARSSSRSGCTRPRRAASRSFIAVNMGGLSEGVVRERAVRPREGRVHRREDGSRRALRAGRRRDALPRRDRHGVAGAAVQAAARAADRRRRARRLVQGAARRRARRLGDERQPAAGGRRGTLPRGPALPAQHDRDPPAAAARPPRRHSRAGRAFPPAPRDALPQGRSPASTRAACRRCSRIRGPATSASSTTRSSARCLLAQGEQVRAADLGLRAGASGAAPRLEELPLEDVEKMLIQKALSRYEGNVSRAAQALGPVAERALPAHRVAWPLGAGRRRPRQYRGPRRGPASRRASRTTNG